MRNKYVEVDGAIAKRLWTRGAKIFNEMACVVANRTSVLGLASFNNNQEALSFAEAFTEECVRLDSKLTEGRKAARKLQAAAEHVPGVKVQSGKNGVAITISHDRATESLWAAVVELLNGEVQQDGK